jgi:hypothetical protein
MKSGDLPEAQQKQVQEAWYGPGEAAGSMREYCSVADGQIPFASDHLHGKETSPGVYATGASTEIEVVKRTRLIDAALVGRGSIWYTAVS